MFQTRLDHGVRLVARRRAFVLTPSIALITLVLNLVWEIIRQNAGSARASWLNFALVDANTTAGLIAIIAGLLLARAQYAQTVNPSVSGRLTRDDVGRSRIPVSRDEPEVEHFYVFNGGPGHTIIESVRYRISFDGTEPRTQLWLYGIEARNALVGGGLADESDFYMMIIGSGVPLPPSSTYASGLHLLSLKADAIAKLSRLDVQVRYRNSLGDLYERIFEVISSVPPAHMARVKKYITPA